MEIPGLNSTRWYAKKISRDFAGSLGYKMDKQFSHKEYSGIGRLKTE
jgi:hypothetical protein